MKRKLFIIIIFIFVVLLGGIALSYASPSKRLVSSPPRNIRVQQTENYLLVTWEKPLRDVDGYRIYRSNAKNILGKVLITINDPNTNSFLDSSVQPNKKYYYTVRSFLSSGAESTNRAQVFKKVVKKPKQLIPITDSSSATCSRINNNTGGDGSYSACIGDTITHSPSGLIAKVLSFDDSKLTLFISGMPGNNTTTLSIYKNNFGYVGGNNGYEVIYKYSGYSASTGANIFITSKTSVNPLIVTPPPATPPNVPKKILTLIVVNNGAESKYEENSWEKMMKQKEDDTTTVFEVAMWDNGVPTNPKKISLYKFGRLFDPRKIVYIDGIYTDYTNGGPAWVEYRESFNILNIALAENATSEDYLSAFKLIMETIIKNQPAEHYGIKYLGHGTDNGALFGWKMNISDSEQFLAYTKSIIGKKIDFLDWNSQCAMGTYNVISREYQYADFILASDLERGDVGVVFGSDGIAITNYNRFKPEAIYLTFFSPSKTIRQSLIDMVNSERSLWETDAWKNAWMSNKAKQSLSIYDTSKFEDLANVTNLSNAINTCDKIDEYNCDVLDYIRKKYPTQVQKFYDFRFHYISNKDFFLWDLDFNGFRIVY